jgi:hypothetical protein
MALLKQLEVEQLQLEISKNNDALLVALQKTEKLRHNNTFYQKIYDDYKKYHDYIILDKQKQRAQMEFLLGYLENSIQGKEISEEMINRAKFEQKNVLKSLNNIRNDLDALTTKNANILQKCKKKNI